MDSWIKNSNNNSSKPSAEVVKAAVEADATLTCSLKKLKFNERNEASHTKKRMYKKNFLQYGFTFIPENNELCPLCSICNQVLAGESLKPAKLKRHLHTKHNSL